MSLLAQPGDADEQICGIIAIGKKLAVTTADFPEDAVQMDGAGHWEKLR